MRVFKSVTIAHTKDCMVNVLTLINVFVIGILSEYCGFLQILQPPQ